MQVKILRDTTPDGLEEKINREFGHSQNPFSKRVYTQYQTAVVPKVRGKEIVGYETEYSALVFVEEDHTELENWIYRPLNSDPGLEKTLGEVEKALGFKLFIWQKTFIERGVFRQYGETTAKILRDLLSTWEKPLDYTGFPGSKIEEFYRKETREIKEKLNGAGIKTREVFFNQEEKAAYMAGKRGI